MKRAPGTFFTVPKSVIPLLPSLQGSDVKVYFSLCAMVNGRTGTCYPAQSTIATECGLGVRTVGAAVERLEQFGLIRVQRSPHRTIVYEVLYLRVGQPHPRTTPATEPSDNPALTGSEPQPGADYTGSPLLEGAQSGSGWIGSLLPVGAQPTADKQEHLTRNKNDSSFVSSEEQSSVGGHPNLDYIDAFHQWQAIYPRLGAPKDALNAFQRAITSLVNDQTVIKHPEITSDENAADFLIERARAYADAQSETERKFLLGPVRWLEEEWYDSGGIDSPVNQPLLPTDDDLVAAGYSVINDYNN